MMIVRLRSLVLVGVCVCTTASSSAQGERLSLEFFDREIVSSYNLMVAKDSKIDEWQEVETAFKSRKSATVEFYFPARHLLENSVPRSPNRGNFEVSTIRVVLGRHTSYFRLVYGVKVTLTPPQIPGQPPPAQLYGMASFVAGRSSNFLQSKEGMEAISDAIMKCISRLQPQN